MARGNYWEYSFRSSESLREQDRRQNGAAHDPAQAGAGDHRCERGDWCVARTRGEDGIWRPALTYQVFCQSDEKVISEQAAQMPGMWLELAARIGDPLRTGRPSGRRPPGSRVLISGVVDALQQEIAAVLGAWAARTRAIPGLDLSAARHAPGTLRRIAEDCAVLAKHTGPLLALTPGPVTRIYDLPAAAREDGLDRAKATCRHCGRVITQSPVSKWWWAPAAGMRTHATDFCGHDPQPGSLTALPRHGPVPDDLAEEIGGQEIVTAGDGWVKVVRDRAGKDAGAEILDLHYRSRRLTGHTPAQREAFDGVPCRRISCEEFALERAAPPSDPSVPAMHSRCSACGDEMDKQEYDQQAKRWASSPGVQVCRRCSAAAPAHDDCRWTACACSEAPHPRRPAARPAA
ncbi:MAG TPA: hypothetical protein VFB06_11290 [Streptosporangiaceae bacterium]|nr:hypothetical protein [Streptosporangiaceae bacterium]